MTAAGDRYLSVRLRLVGDPISGADGGYVPWSCSNSPGLEKREIGTLVVDLTGLGLTWVDSACLDWAWYDMAELGVAWLN